jgi:hypothetical protein
MHVEAHETATPGILWAIVIDVNGSGCMTAAWIRQRKTPRPPTRTPEQFTGFSRYCQVMRGVSAMTQRACNSPPTMALTRWTMAA